MAPSRIALASIGFVVSLTSMQALAACQPGPFEVSFPGQRLDERLQAVAHTTGCPIDVDTSTLGKARAKPTKGSLSTEQLVIASVRGTGFEAHLDQGQWKVDRAEQDAFAQRIAELKQSAGEKSLDAKDRAHVDQQLARVEKGVAELVRKQGFLSAAEKASYTRDVNDVARRVGAQ